MDSGFAITPTALLFKSYVLFSSYQGSKDATKSKSSLNVV